MIDQFRGEYAFLSNFHPLTNPIKSANLTLFTNEHFFCVHKTFDLQDRLWIAQQPTPALAKKAAGPNGLDGRKIELRADWPQVDTQVMFTGLILKFMANYDLATKFMETRGRRLVEGNWWHDNYWGNCTCVKCTHIPGQNNLGQLLEAARDLLFNIRI